MWGCEDERREGERSNTKKGRERERAMSKRDACVHGQTKALARSSLLLGADTRKTASRQATNRENCTAALQPKGAPSVPVCAPPSRRPFTPASPASASASLSHGLLSSRLAPARRRHLAFKDLWRQWPIPIQGICSRIHVRRLSLGGVSQVNTTHTTLQLDKIGPTPSD